MIHGLPCPLCGAPIKVDSQMAECDLRCPSCGHPSNLVIEQGAMSLIPVAIVARPASRRRNHESSVAFFNLLPILVPVASLAVVVGAIAIRMVREAKTTQRIERSEATTVAPSNRPSKVESQLQPPSFAVHRPSPPPPATTSSLAVETPGSLEADRAQLNPAAFHEVAAAAPPDEADEARPAEKPKPFDDIKFFEDLREAKRKFKATIAADTPRLIDECQEVVKREAARTGDLVLAKELLNEVAQLKETGKLPTKPQFEAPRKRHLELHRTEAHELHAVYKAAIDALVKDLQIQRAIEIKDEMDEFVEKERQLLGIPETSPSLPKSGPGKPVLDKPLLLDLQVERQSRDCDDPDPTSKVLLRVIELADFPEGAKFRSDESVAPVGTPLLIEFPTMAGPQIEISLRRNPSKRKLQLQVEPVFVEAGNREFELTFPRLDKFELGVRNSLTRLENEIPGLDASLSNVRAEGEAALARIASRLSGGYINALQADALSRQAVTVTQNNLARLQKRLVNARQDLPKLAARLSAVPDMRSFMESIHQQAAIKYTISIVREGNETIFVDARQ